MYLLIFIFAYLGLLDTLNEMNTKLEEIQKSLDMYLETKRQIFPRFYFLSNDDLLEILGQSKNPDAVSSFINLKKSHKKFHKITLYNFVTNLGLVSYVVLLLFVMQYFGDLIS